MHGGGYFYGLFIKAALYDSELSEARIWQKIYYSWSVASRSPRSLFRIFQGGAVQADVCVTKTLLLSHVGGANKNIEIYGEW